MDEGERPPQQALIPRLDFQIVGAMKCGTTTVRDALRAHPDVHAPAREVHFFDDDGLYASVWREARLDAAALEAAYARPLRSGKPVVGCKTPSYLASPTALGRLHGFHPRARIVVMLRDPVERARSHWDHLRRQAGRGRVPADRVAATLSQQIARDEAELLAARSGGTECSVTNVLWRGCYAEQLRSLGRLYPAERVFVALLDELRDERERFFRRLLGFLGLRWDAAVLARRDEETRPRGSVHRMTPAERDSLRAFYAGQVRELESLLGRDLGGWR